MYLLVLLADISLFGFIFEASGDKTQRQTGVSENQRTETVKLALI